MTMLNPAVGRVLKRPHHPLDVILICLRWYVADRLSLRSLDDMMAERGVSVDHSTVQRWAIKSRTKIRLARLRDRHVFGRQHSGCQGIGKVGAAWLSRTSFEGHVRPRCWHASWPERRCQYSGRCRDRPLAAVARRSVAPGFGRVHCALATTTGWVSRGLCGEVPRQDRHAIRRWQRGAGRSQKAGGEPVARVFVGPRSAQVTNVTAIA